MNVAIISHSIIPSVLLCGYAQCEYLKSTNKIDYRFVVARKIKADDLNWADIIVFVRSESYLEAYASEICKGKKHLVYILDDDLLNLPDYVSCAKYYKIKGIHNNIEKIIKNCNTFISPSPILLEKYGKWCDNSYLIDEPSLDSIEAKTKNEKIKIGFAGSIDRTKDINDILTDGLEEIINKYKDKISVEFMGAKPDLVDKYNLKYIPYQNGYSKYTEIVKEANWDIGLAPMPISDFHKCKYFNKYVEYASFGMVGIYTNSEPYTFGIRNRENGILVNNNKNEWINAISELIENNEFRNRISKTCLQEAKDEYSLETCSKQFFEKITNHYVKADSSLIVISLKGKLSILLAMIKDKILVQRWRFPFWCVKFIIVKILEKIGLYKKEELNDWKLQ